ncbi:hypothetical protein [Isoptericola sediminis]|uniref:Uncharacterized protein n=1 Tax=Isoptericola sediminis TaxID=2733572 RepID=A0A849K9M0_9MICO|nr:hypothetical protein [Isoptericola sediminis]NNU28455.1 hypothetical protein [Isoptericola sediminis]
MGDANNAPTKALNSKVSAEVRAQRAWTARVAGATWDQVAQVTGYHDRATAHRAVKDYFGQVPRQDAEMTRAMWRERMEVLWRQVVRDASQQKPGAIRAGVAVAQRAAAMDGLDAPQEVRVGPMGDAAMYGGDPVEFIRQGGALTAADMERYGITEDQVRAIRAGEDV